jgi:two-component sensor histidine kinase
MDKGSITVQLVSRGDDHTLTVADDGVGLPENFEFKKTDSLGLELVNNLVGQIDGEIILDTSKGTEFKIVFKELDYKKRF